MHRDLLLSSWELLQLFEDVSGTLHLLLSRVIAFPLQAKQFDHPGVKFFYVIFALFLVIFREMEELDQLKGRASDLELEYPHNLRRGYLGLFEISQ